VVTKVEWGADGKSAKLRRAVDGGAEEVIDSALPMVIAAHKGLNTPRYASLPGIMKAKKVPVDVVEISALGTGPQDAKTELCDFELPPEKAPGKVLKGSAEELAKQIVTALRNEVKVI
jgi:electron transfer flavoprotein beta subunit